MSAINPSDGAVDTARRHPVLRALLSGSAPAVMGILNITPDSFSDGGQFSSPDMALAHARRMANEGAAIIDIGAESTRPYDGATPVSVAEEKRRLRAVLPELLALKLPVSIDTMKAKIADWALGAGAAIANDVWGLQRDPDMAKVVADHGKPIVIMHNREEAIPALDVIADIRDFFKRSLEIADSAGIVHDNIVLDPGIGFGKTPEQSMTALARLNELDTFDLPILVGASRKRFIASVTPSEPDRRLGGSIAAHVIAAERGARIIRAHDVAETVQAMQIASAIWKQR